MGVNTDGEEMGPGSTVTDGVKDTEKTCGFEQETENEKSLPQDADGDVGIQDQTAKGTGIPLITLQQNMPSQHISGALNTEPKEAKINHTDGGYSITLTLLRPDADIEDINSELSHGAHVSLDTDASADDKCVLMEERTSSLQEGEIIEMLETDANDDWDAMYNTLLDEINSSAANAFKLELPFNPDIDQMDEEGYTPLYKAASEGHLEGVDDLISQGSDPNKPSKGGLRPLHAAAQEGHAHIVDFLILQGADVSVECELGQTPLHTAAAKGYVAILESFIAEGNDLNKEDNTGWTPFNAAVQYGHLEAVKCLMTKGAKQNRYDGMTPLYAAVQSGHLDIVKFFISIGARVNEEHEDRKIPLHGAAARGHVKVMEYLIQQGSDVNKEDVMGLTPFNAAVQYGHQEAVKYLLTNGAKQNRFDGMTPLYAAAQFGHLDILKFFISKGADINEENDDGVIPLHGAACNGHIKIMRYIIQLGSDVNKVNARGWTPFNAAVQYGHLEAVKCLMTKGAKQNRYDGMTPLYAAAQCGHLDIVKFFISKGANVNEGDEKGNISLHGAAFHGHLEVMEYLIQQGSDLNNEDNTGCTPFNAAVQEGHLEVVRYLVTTRAQQNRYDGMTPLYAAAQCGHLDIVKLFISNGADVNEEDDEGMVPLHGAAIDGNVEVMKYLVQLGSDVNWRDKTGWSPFNAAVQYGNLEAVKYLLGMKAAQNIYNEITPLSSAARFGHVYLVKYFISKGVDVNEKNYAGRIPLHDAAIHGNTEVMEYLIQQGSDLNKGDLKGWTPFNAAVQYGHLEAVTYLLTKEVKQNRQNGMTPLHAAAHFGHLEIVEYFVSKGADVNEENDKGKIPLHGAAAQGHVEVMEYLIQQGSDVNKGDLKGWTPFNAAVQSGHLEAVKYLRNEGAKQTIHDGMTPLYPAAHFGHLEIVKFFISEGADENEPNNKELIPLHGAAIRGHTTVKEYLIQQGLYVNKTDNKRWTPFIASVRDDRLKAVKYLMAKEARGSMFYGLTPLYIATQYEHVDVVNFLVSSGYDVNERNECGKSPLHAECYNGNMDIVKVLIHHNANVNEQDDNEWTPLHAAAQEGHKDIVDYLILHGADINLKDIDGLTPLQAAANACRLNTIEDISPSRGDPDMEEKGASRPGGHQNHITRGYVAVKMKDADTQPLNPSQIDNAEEGNDCIQAHNSKRGADDPSLKSLPIRTNDDGKGGNEEHNPFIQAELKYPDKSEQVPMLDRMKAITCPGTRKRRTTTNDTDCSSPRGPQTGQYGGFDPPYLQTRESDGHPSEESESRCHSLIDENREITESSSPMNAGDDLPINEPSEIESSPTRPPTVVHQKLYDGNPVTSHGTTSNPVWKIRALGQTFLQMIVALAIILAGSPVLVAGRDITERVTLQAGKPGLVPFHFQWSPSDTSRVVPFYTLRFASIPRPFSINGKVDIEGFKNPSQIRRFSTSVTDLDTSLCVNLMIDEVDTADEDEYVSTTVWHSFESVRHETVKKEIVVQIPPGSAKCSITLSGNVDYPYEIHCRATTGSVATTLSCYQDDQRLDVTGDITDNGLITSGIFLLLDYTHFSCCSHDVTLHVNETTCNDFEWPPIKETTMQTVNFVPTSVTTPIPQVESHAESGACRQFMMPSLWQFTYMFVYILAFVTMY